MRESTDKGRNKETDTSRRARIIFPPPLLFLACLGTGAALEFTFHTRPEGVPRLPEIAGGTILSLLSGIIALSAVITFRLHRTPVDPYKPTARIVQAGPFRFSRNPMYLSLLLLLSSLAVLSCSLWIVLSVPALFLLLEFGVVRREEVYLAEQFGEEYIEYTKRVRRWF